MGPMTSDDLACQEAVELVSAYLDGQLSDPERTRFERHLGECPHCARYLDQVRETIRLVGCISQETLDPAARHDLIQLYRRWTADGVSS